MNGLKKFAAHTAIYGLSSIVARSINFLLTPVYTKFLPSVNAFGVITTLFAYCSFFNIFLTFGMETALFNFTQKSNNPKQVFAVATRWVFLLSFFFFGICFIFSKQIMNLIGYANFPKYAIYIAGIIVLDALTAIGMAKVRLDQKALKFAFYRMLNIGINVFFNFFFLIFAPFLAKNGFKSLQFTLNSNLQIDFILISQLIACLVGLICVFNILKSSLNEPKNKKLFKEMLSYSWPLVIAGIAGMINETLDRIILKKLVINGDFETGIYSGFYKISMLISMFLQAYRYAIEPILFKNIQIQNTKLKIAQTTKWFAYVCSIVFISTLAITPEFSRIIMQNPNYFLDNRGFYIVPILLVANICLGMYFNLSMWFKLTNSTKFGLVFTIVGAFSTILINILFVPKFSFIACAFATLISYGIMMILAIIVGQKKYPIPFEITKITSILLVSITLSWFIYSYGLNRILQVLLLIIILLSIYLLEKNEFKRSTNN